MDCSLSGSSIHGIFQAKVLEWIAISFSRGSSQPRNRTQVSHIAGRRFSIWATREAQARILECIGQHWLPYYISCHPSRQPPWVPGAARTPATQAAAPPPHLALSGSNPSPPGQPQEQTPVDDPHVEVEIKPQLKPRGSVAKEEDPKPSHQLYKLQIKSTQSTRQTLCLWNI